MRCELITLILLFGIIIFCVTATRIYHNETPPKWPTSIKNQSEVASFVLVNPRQIKDAELTIKHFLTRLTGPIARSTLRLSFPDLQSTISEISKVIRAKIIEFARASGLTTSVRQYEQTPRNSTISEDWFTEGLVQGSLLLCDLIRVGEEVWFTIDHYFDMYNVTLHEDKELSSRKLTKSFKFLSTINDAARFNEKLFKCMSPVRDRGNPSSFFNLERTLTNLAKSSPDNTVKLFKSRLDRAFSQSTPSNGTRGERLYVLLCHSLVQRASHYSDCIKELRRLVSCVSSSRQGNNEVIAHHTFLAKPWLAAIEDLSGCKIYIDEDGSASVRCNFDHRLPRTTMRQVKYVYEKILYRRISRRSSLHRVANELGGVLSRSRWGRQFAYDASQYLEIYQEGRRRLNALSKNASKDKRVATRCKKISASLNVYKNGALKQTMLAINNFHRFTLQMQQFLIRGIRSSSQDSWQTHFKILACLSEWMTKLLELFGCVHMDETDVDMSTDIPPINTTNSDSTMTSDDLYDGNNQIKYLALYRKKDQIKKETDKAFEKLMHSMNHIARVQSRKAGSTLACLANNLLLITIFMETIGFVSTLFCFGEHEDESNVEGLGEQWIPERERRSLSSIDFTEIDTIKEASLMILETSDEIANNYNEENVNFSRNMLINVTNSFYDLIKITPRSVKSNEQLAKSILLK